VGRKPRDIGVSIEELARRYRSGESIEAIAAATGVNDWTVRHRLLRAGVVMRAPGRVRRPRLDLDDAEIIERYRAGETTTAIAASLGVSHHAIRERLVWAGVERRRPGPLPGSRRRESRGAGQQTA
jgi:uncharacterized protein (DUF433 family)